MGAQSLTFTEAQKRIERDLKPPKHELEAHTRDFLTNSFLIRRGDEFRLSHKSILEYLVAMRLNKEIESDYPEVFGTIKIDHAVLNFLEKFEPNTETLFEWIRSTKGGVKGEGAWLGTNAADLLNRISNDYFARKDLSDTTLIRVGLRDADLRGTKLNNTQLSGADLTGAKFFKKDIVSATIHNALFSCYALKTNQTRKLSPLDVLDEVIEIFQYELEVGIKAESYFRSDLLWEITVPAKDMQHLEFCRETLATKLSTKVVIYFDECEKLAQEQDLAKVRRKQRAIRMRSR